MGSPLEKSIISIAPKQEKIRNNSSSSYSSGSVKFSPPREEMETETEILQINYTYDLNKAFENYPNSCFNSGDISQNPSTWIVDSRATSHMCNDPNLFQKMSYRENLGWVKIADGKGYSIKATGTISLSIKHGSEFLLLVLHNVNFVPEFDTNLISVKKLTEQGMSITFSKHGCHAQTHKKVFELAKYKTSGYVLNEFNGHHEARPCIHEWHNRMAHKNLESIKKNKETLGLKINKCTCTDECIPCMQGKLTALPFPKQAEKPSKCLDIVVSDVGEMPVKSLGKSKYFITFTDIFSEFLYEDSEGETTEASPGERIVLKLRPTEYPDQIISDPDREIVEKLITKLCTKAKMK